MHALKDYDTAFLIFKPFKTQKVFIFCAYIHYNNTKNV
jgi:hypothetical protein